jgi:hypothetical protein
MTTSVKTVAFNLQNLGKSESSSNNYDDNNYDDNNYDANYAKVTQHKSISHGTDFNQYQLGLKKKAIEGFNGQNDLTDESESVLLKTQISNEQQQKLTQLKQDLVLNQTRYNSLINTISPTTDNSAKLQQLALLETTLDLLSQQINALNEILKNNVTTVNAQISSNSISREKYVKDITSNNTNEANMLDISNNIQNILNDSNIVTLQKNYSYILLSILAAASVLVAMNVIKNN